ncbi:hypothetical protein BH11CYA1_BH11CYA1_13080 [soil metagenome]
MDLDKVMVAAALASFLTFPLTAAFASEREANGWIYANLDEDGLKLTYPASWKKTMIGSQPSEHDNILKVSGQLTGADDSWAELSLLHSQAGMSPSLLIKVMEETYWSKLPEYKGYADKPIRMPGAQAAVEKEISFRQAGALFSQRCLVFQIGSKSYSLIMTCPSSQLSATGTIWNAAVSSVDSASSVALAATAGPPKLKSITAKTSSQKSAGSVNANSVSANSATAGSEQLWRTKDGVLSLAFPSSLKEAVVDGDDHLLKASSNEPGKMINLDVYRGDIDHNLSLAELSSSLEEKYFLTLKNYQKVGEEARSIGSGGGVPGVVRESTFEMNGVKVHHLSGYVMVDKNLYAICLSTAGVNSNEAHQVWSRVASSVTVKR